jgi:hypothetical protein
LWDNLSIISRFKDGTLVAVTDGSYICELYLNLCSAAFVIECAKGQGLLMGSFLDALLVANSYRGELLCLMAIHLILLSIDRVYSNLLGSVEIISDCLGALRQVTDLPPYRILSRCKALQYSEEHPGKLSRFVLHNIPLTCEGAPRQLGIIRKPKSKGTTKLHLQLYSKTANSS